MSDLERSLSRSPMSDRKGRSVSPAPARGATKSRSRSVGRSFSRSPSRSPRRQQYRSRTRSRSRDTRPKYRSRSRSRSQGYRHRRDSERERKPRDRYRSNRSHSRSPMSSRRRHLGSRENPKTSRCVGVFGLSLYTQERDLRDHFSKYGPIDECNIVYDHQTGRSRGFAFIYYRNLADAEEAKEDGPGQEIDGRRIRCDFSITERAHTPTPGIYLGKPTSRSSRGDYYRGGGGSSRDYGRRSPSPYYNDRRRSRYSRSRSRSYSPRRY